MPAPQAAAAKPRVPAVEGWFTTDADDPRLLGNRCTTCGTWFFPKAEAFCRNPDCEGSDLEEAALSNRGRVWSYTNACYQPPDPYIAADPFVPFALAAVELAEEKLVVLGQVVEGVGVEALRVGQEVRLALGTLYEDDDHEYVVWKWAPA